MAAAAQRFWIVTDSLPCRTPDSGPTPTVGECEAEATLTEPRSAVRGDAECGVRWREVAGRVMYNLSYGRRVQCKARKQAAGRSRREPGDAELTQRLQDSRDRARDPTSRHSPQPMSRNGLLRA